MKKTLLSIIILFTSALSHAVNVEKTENYQIPKTSANKSIDTEQNVVYMKKVFNKIPDMLEKGEKSKKRSLREGAALQLVTGSVDFYNTGITPESLASLINSEARGVKKFFKEKNMKGYFFVNHEFLISKGQPNLDQEELEQFRNQANCKNEYCTIVLVTNMKLLDENGKEQEFSRRDLAQYIKNEDKPNEFLEINPDFIQNSYETVKLKLVLGYGLSGLDSLEFISPKKDK